MDEGFFGEREMLAIVAAILLGRESFDLREEATIDDQTPVIVNAVATAACLLSASARLIDHCMANEMRRGGLVEREGLES
jgi:hypothetical protein